MLPLWTKVTLLLVGHGVLDRGADEALGALGAHRLEAEPRGRREADLLVVLRELLLEEGEHLLGLGALRLPLDAGVDVLGVLPEDHHVDVAGLLHRARHPLEPADGAQADVEVEELAQRHVQRADAAADRRRERPLDADEVLLEVLDRLVGEPVAGLLERLLAREDLVPRDLLLPAVGLLHGGVEDADARAPDVPPRPVALDEGDDRVVRDVELVPSAHRDRLAIRSGGHVRTSVRRGPRARASGLEGFKKWAQGVPRRGRGVKGATGPRSRCARPSPHPPSVSGRSGS